MFFQTLLTFIAQRDRMLCSLRLNNFSCMYLVNIYHSGCVDNCFVLSGVKAKVILNKEAG